MCSKHYFKKTLVYGIEMLQCKCGAVRSEKDMEKKRK